MRRVLWVLICVGVLLAPVVFAQQTEIPLPEAAVARLGLGTIEAIACSPDGETLAVATNLCVELRDVETLELQKRILTGHTGRVLSVAYSPDGKTIASGSEDGTIKLWHASSGTLLRTLTEHTRGVYSVAFSPDWKTIASGETDNTIKLWDIATGTLVHTLIGHTGDVMSVAFSPDGKTIASGSEDDTIKLWNASSGKLLRTLTGHTDWVDSVAFSPDGKTIASGSEDDTIKLWNVSSGKLLRTLTGHTKSVAFSPDGNTIVSKGSWDYTIKLWNASSGNLLRTLTGHTGWVTSVAYSPDGNTIASGSYDGTIKLWNVSTGNLMRTLPGHTGRVTSVAYSPDSETIASGSYDDTIKLWDASTRTLLHTLAGATGAAASIVFSPDGSSAAGSWDNAIKLWNVSTGNLLRTLTGHTGQVSSVAYSPDGETIASGSYDDTIKLWNASTGNLLRTLTGHTDAVTSVAFSPDGELLASGSYDNTIKLWDTSSGTLLRTLLTGHTGPVSSVAYSPDGNTIAAGSWDNAIKLWNVSTGNLLRTLTGHTGQVSSVAYSPDGETIASGSYDDTIKLWNASTGNLLRTLTGHTGWVSSVAYSPDGTTLASGSWDGTILLWELESILHPNKLPTAEFTTYILSPSGARLLVLPKTGERVWFDASGSSDNDGTVVKYAWDWQSDGEVDATTTDSVIGHIFSTSGKYNVTLQVTDDKAGTAKITKPVTIGAKQPPNASFTFSPVEPSILDTVRFTDSSSDSDGEIKSWQWEFGDGGSSTATNPTHQYTEKKTYTVKLTVTDDDGLTDVVTKQLTVVNLAPTAAFSFSPQQPYVNQPVFFDASSSTDKDGAITSYAWDFNGDGKTDAQGEKVSRAFTEGGTVGVTLTVTDDDGDTASQQREITVKPTPPGPPKFENLWGLVVGIADYEDESINDLKFTEDDAQAFYNFLVDRGGGGFPKDHVQYLLGQQATRQAMQGGFKWLINHAEQDDLVVVYYAGHGSTGPDYNHDEQDGLDEYLIPYDTQASDLFTTAIRDDEIGDWLTSIKCTHILLVFDSCFSGGATRAVRSFNKEGMRAGPGNQVFTDLAADGRLILAASQEDEPSYEDPPLNHGVFTYFLLQGLGVSEDPDHPGETTPKADANEDGRITVAELQTYLTQEVPQYIKDVMHEQPQHPLISGDTTLRDIAWNVYGVPLLGEVTAIQGETVIISLGSKQGIQPGDQFEVIRPLTLPDGATVNEVEATIEVIYILGPDRAGCKVTKSMFPIAVKDEVHLAQ